MLKTFRWALLVTLLALVGALVLGGVQALVLVAILGVLEISMSFDNAVVNATVLVRFNPAWQRLFLTVGILIAVFGMRLVFPLLVVAATAHQDPVSVVHLALKGGSVDTPGTYANLLHAAHGSIAAFGGMFLGMLFLDFVFEDREISWLAWIERPLARIGKLDQISTVVSLAGLIACAHFLSDHPATLMISGAFGIGAYLLVNAVAEFFESEEDEEQDEERTELAEHGSVRHVAGKAALALFLYLELLDASFSFDGVIGAFAITQDIFIIAVGLGIGAMFIRSLTVYLVNKGILDEYVYLEHGAHWAIGALAAILLITIKYDVPEVITGLIGVAFIAAAFLASVLRNRRNEAGRGPASPTAGTPAHEEVEADGDRLQQGL